ncbi:MAG: immunoglobulin-like domain-containing protein, partial [Sarcina sp.]
KPNIIGANSVTIKVGDTFNAVDGITALDKEDGDLSGSIKILGEVDTTKEGVNTLVYSVEDRDGNTSLIRRIIKVRSNEKPKIIVDNITTLKIGSTFHQLNDVIATDVEDGDITKNIKVTGTVNTANIGEYDLLYSIEDSDGNKIDKARKIRVESNEKPTINGTDNKIIKIGDKFDPLEGIIATDNEDKDLTNKIKVEGKVINTVKGQYNLTYTVTDSDGNTCTNERIINVKTNNTPKIFGVEDTIIKVGEKFENTSAAILAIDDEDGDITNLVSIEGKVDINLPGEYKLTYSVTDSDGNIAKTERKVTVKSNNKPVLEGIKDYTIKVGDGFNILEGVSAHDVEDLNLTDKIIVSGSVDSSKEGLYKIEYSVKDSDNNKVSKNSLVIVKSNENPRFFNVKERFIKIGDSFNPLNVGIIVLDKEDGDLTNKIKVEGKVDTTKIGEYNLIYSVEDSDGNISKATKKVWVRSNTPPTLEGLYKTTIKIGEPFLPLKNVFAKDSEDGDLTPNIQIEGTVDTLKAGFYKLTYHVHDVDGNAVSKTRDIIVKSNTAPKIIGANNMSIKAYNTFHKELGVEAFDTEGGYLTDHIIIEGEVDVNSPGKYILLYKVKDLDDNETIIERVITVESNEIPIIKGASDIILKIKDNFNPLEGIIATDKEDGDLTPNIQVEGIVDTQKEGLYPLVYKVSDKDNNISKVTRNIKIRSNDNPIIL